MREILILTKKTLYQSRFSLFWMAVIALTLALMWVSLFPFVKDIGTDLSGYFETLPPEMRELMNVDSFDYPKFEVYISSEYFGFFWVIAYMPFILVWATTIAKRAEDGTLGVLLAQGVSRSENSVASYIDLFIKSLFTSFTIVWSIVLMAFLWDIDIELGNWIMFNLILFLFILAFSFTSIAISILIVKRSTALILSAGILVISYLINVISSLYDKLENIKYLSPFYYFGVPLEILEGDYDISSLLFFVLTIIISILVGLIFAKKIELPKG